MPRIEFTQPNSAEDDALDYLSRIDDMLCDERYEFASDTLSGIRDWIDKRHYITENQKQAIDNIEGSVI